MGENKGKSIKELVERTHGQSQRGWVWGWEVGMGGPGESWWGEDGDNNT